MVAAIILSLAHERDWAGPQLAICCKVIEHAGAGWLWSALDSHPQHLVAELQQVKMCDCAAQGESLLLPACLLPGGRHLWWAKAAARRPAWLPVLLEQRHLFRSRWIHGATGPCRCSPGSAGAKH